MMDYKRLLELISKPWLNTNEIMQVAECGRNTATRIRMEIEQMIIDSGKILPKSNKKHVPTRMVLAYLGMDEEYIKNMASLL